MTQESATQDASGGDFMKTKVGLGLLALLGIVHVSMVHADMITNEALLALAKTQGTNVYHECILTPPVTPQQKAFCSALYAVYKIYITALNTPYPLVIAVEPDPYSWSPYDICRYEVGHMVFGDEGIEPYCPTNLL